MDKKKKERISISNIMNGFKRGALMLLTFLIFESFAVYLTPTTNILYFDKEPEAGFVSQELKQGFRTVVPGIIVDSMIQATDVPAEELGVRFGTHYVVDETESRYSVFGPNMSILAEKMKQPLLEQDEINFKTMCAAVMNQIQNLEIEAYGEVIADDLLVNSHKYIVPVKIKEFPFYGECIEVNYRGFLSIIQNESETGIYLVGCPEVSETEVVKETLQINIDMTKHFEMGSKEDLEKEFDHYKNKSLFMNILNICGAVTMIVIVDRLYTKRIRRKDGERLG